MREQVVASFVSRWSKCIFHVLWSEARRSTSTTCVKRHDRSPDFRLTNLKLNTVIRWGCSFVCGCRRVFRTEQCFVLKSRWQESIVAGCQPDSSLDISFVKFGSNQFGVVVVPRACWFLRDWNGKVYSPLLKAFICCCMVLPSEALTFLPARVGLRRQQEGMIR